MEPSVQERPWGLPMVLHHAQLPGDPGQTYLKVRRTVLGTTHPGQEFTGIVHPPLEGEIAHLGLTINSELPGLGLEPGDIMVTGAWTNPGAQETAYEKFIQPALHEAGISGEPAVIGDREHTQLIGCFTAPLAPRLDPRFAIAPVILWPAEVLGGQDPERLYLAVAERIGTEMPPELVAHTAYRIRASGDAGDSLFITEIWADPLAQQRFAEGRVTRALRAVFGEFALDPDSTQPLNAQAAPLGQAAVPGYRFPPTD